MEKSLFILERVINEFRSLQQISQVEMANMFRK